MEHRESHIPKEVEQFASNQVEPVEVNELAGSQTATELAQQQAVAEEHIDLGYN